MDQRIDWDALRKAMEQAHMYEGWHKIPVIVIKKIFVKRNIKKNLDTVSKMIVYRFMYNLTNTKDI